MDVYFKVAFSLMRACLSLSAIDLVDTFFLTAVVPSSLTSRLLLVVPNACAREGEATVKDILIDVILSLFFCKVNCLLRRLNSVRHQDLIQSDIKTVEDVNIVKC